MYYLTVYMNERHLKHTYIIYVVNLNGFDLLFVTTKRM